MPRVLIEAGHYPNGGGAPGEAAWAYELGHRLATKLEANGIQVAVIGTFFGGGDPAVQRRIRPTQVLEDWDLSLHLHFDGATYGAGRNSGAFADRARYDPMGHESDRFISVWEPLYRQTGIPMMHGRRGPNTWAYYAFNHTTDSTPGVLLEHGVGALVGKDGYPPGDDATLLHDRIDWLASLDAQAVLHFLARQRFQLRCPLWDGPRGITQTFGLDWLYYKNAVGLTAGHNGLDADLPLLTPLYSPPGVVTFSGSDPTGYGEVVRIALDGGGELLEAHLHERLVQTGQRLDGRSLVGYSGETGLSSGPHVHIGHRPRPGAAHDDPLAWLASLAPEEDGEDMTRITELEEALRLMTEGRDSLNGVAAELQVQLGAVRGELGRRDSELGALKAHVVAPLEEKVRRGAEIGLRLQPKRMSVAERQRLGQELIGWTRG